MTHKDKVAAIAKQFRRAVENKYSVIEMKLLIYQNIQKEGIAI